MFRDGSFGAIEAAFNMTHQGYMTHRRYSAIEAVSINMTHRRYSAIEAVSINMTHRGYSAIEAVSFNNEPPMVFSY